MHGLNHAARLLPLVTLLGCSEQATAPAETATTAAMAENVVADAFRMPVIDVTGLNGRGVLLTGVIRSGHVSLDDTVCLTSARIGIRELPILAIEVRGANAASARVGDMAAILVTGVRRDDVSRGDELSGRCAS